MSTFLAGLTSRRWLNLGVFVLGALAMLVAVATPLYARSSAEHLLDQRTEQRPVTETGLNVEVAAAVGPDGHFTGVAYTPAATQADAFDGPPRLDDSDRAAMLATVTDLMGSDAADSFWRSPTPYLLSQGEYRSGGTPYQINTYWREGMCAAAEVVGRCPSGPEEALIDPVMLRTISAQVGDQVAVHFAVTVDTADGSQTVQDVPQELTIVGTYTIADDADTTWFDPGRTGGDATLRPPSLGSSTPPTAPALLVDRPAISLAAVTKAGVDRPIDLDAVDIDTMDAAQAALMTFQAEVADQGPPVLQTEDLVTFDNLFTAVRAEQSLLSRVTLAAVVPLVVLALLLLYVLISAAAEVRRQEVALAKLRGFSTRKVVRFAVAEPAIVLALAVPVGIVLAVVASRLVSGLWLGDTPMVVTPQAVASAVVVAGTALLAALVAVLAVVREPLATALASASRRRTTSRWALLGQGALVMLSVAAVVQIATSKADSSSSFVELLAPLFVALGVSVLAMAGVGLLARVWLARTDDRGGLSPFLASRRLVRRQDLLQLVLPLLLATSMATFAASAWKVADDWRVSKASASVGADRAYFTDTAPARLLWVAREADPDGRYLTAVVPPTPRTEDGARVALVDTRSFANVAAWDDSWSSSVDAVGDLLSPPDRGSPITITGERLTVSLTDVDLTGSLNLPLEMWLRYVSSDSGEERLAKIGTVPLQGSAEVEGFVSECTAGCDVEQLYVAGSSSSVTDVGGTFTIADVRSDNGAGGWRLDDPSAWRAARPFGIDGNSPVQLEGGPGGLKVTVTKSAGAVLRMTTTDLPEAPPVVTTTGTAADDLGQDTVDGASILGARTPMQVVGTTASLPVVGDNGGLSDLRSALREYGDQSSNVSITELLVAPGTPRSVLRNVEDQGVDLSDPRTFDGELDVLRSDAFSLGWKVFLLVGVLTLLLAFLGVLALAVVQLRWRSYEVAALRVVGVRRKDLRRAVVTEYVALLGVAVVGGALAAIASLLLVLPSMDIGERGTYDPAVDYGLRWLVMAGVLGLVLVVVLAIAAWIAGRTVKLGTPATLRQADNR